MVQDTRNLVSVYGRGLSAPLLQTDNVRLIQIRDGDGKVTALFWRVTDTLWGFSSRGDADFEEHRKHLEIDDTRT